MTTQFDLDAWEEVEPLIRRLGVDTRAAADPPDVAFSQFLFRGHGDAAWALLSTLERTNPALRKVIDYYERIIVAKTQIETFTNRSWPDLDYWKVARDLERYDLLRTGELPAYEYLVYLRHHGFPSPLLDWTASLYIAAFFAFHRPSGSRVAIHVYQEFAGHGKSSGSDQPQIHQFGPYVRSHPRHFVQQAEYTLCVQYEDGQWQLAQHSHAFAVYGVQQDRLWKITLPSSEAKKVLKRLDEYNINEFSLFQSEEALMQTLARRIL